MYTYKCLLYLHTHISIKKEERVKWEGRETKRGREWRERGPRFEQYTL